MFFFRQWTVKQEERKSVISMKFENTDYSDFGMYQPRMIVGAELLGIKPLLELRVVSPGNFNMFIM